MNYIHERKFVVHRDIKLENVLLTNLGRIKLCDMGVSVSLKDYPKGITDCSGTPAYMAPEVIGIGNLQKEMQNSKGTNDKTLRKRINAESYN